MGAANLLVSNFGIQFLSFAERQAIQLRCALPTNSAGGQVGLGVKAPPQVQSRRSWWRGAQHYSEVIGASATRPPTSRTEVLNPAGPPTPAGFAFNAARSFSGLSAPRVSVLCPPAVRRRAKISRRFGQTGNSNRFSQYGCRRSGGRSKTVRRPGWPRTGLLPGRRSGTRHCR